MSRLSRFVIEYPRLSTALLILTVVAVIVLVSVFGHAARAEA